MQNIIIVCEDSFGLDVLMIIQAINRALKNENKQQAYNVVGFLNASNHELKAYGNDYSVLGNLERWIPSSNEAYAMGILDPWHKEYAVKTLKTRGAKFVTLVAPWVVDSQNIVFGEGCIIAAKSIKKDAKIDDFVTLSFCMLGNAHIEEFSSVMAFSNITNAHLGKRCFLKENIAIMLNVSLANDVCVLANSIVFKSVTSKCTLFGIPAKKVRVDT